MPNRDSATTEAEAIGRKLIEVLGDAAVEKTARRCGLGNVVEPRAPLSTSYRSRPSKS